MHLRLRQTIAALSFLGLVGCSTMPAPRSARPAAIGVLPAAQRMRVMTFNVQSCKAGLDAVAATIASAEPDLVALQEVDNGTRRARGIDQTRELAKRLGFAHAIHIPTTRLFGGDYGMALLSRHPVVAASAHRLPVEPGMEPRVIYRAVLDVEGRQVAVYAAHLSAMPPRSSLRTAQARVIARMIAEDPLPRILLGDLNDVASSAPVAIFSHHLEDSWRKAGEGPAGTFPLPLVGTLRYDYVFTSPDVEVLRTFVVRKRVSDHYPVVSDLAIPAPEPTSLAERQ